MMLAIIIIFAIVFILALIYVIGFLVAKRELSTRKKYQEHIDNLVTELFPPAIPTIPTPAVNTQTSYETYDPQEDTVQEDTVQYQEAKRKMVANIRTYFNQRKMKIDSIPHDVGMIGHPDENTLYLQ